MRLTFVLLLSVGCLPARADQCDARTADVVRLTGATFERRALESGSVFFKHPLTRSFVITCGGAGDILRTSVDISTGNAYPTNNYFNLVATTAHVAMDLPPAAVRAAAIRCHKRALASPDETDEIANKILEVDCHAFRRDGGSTTITVSPPRSDQSGR